MTELEQVYAQLTAVQERCTELTEVNRKLRRALGSAKLADYCSELGAQELVVLTALARRLLMGQLRYGQVNLGKDNRDWLRERAEEFADALIYTAFAEVAAKLGE